MLMNEIRTTKHSYRLRNGWVWFLLIGAVASFIYRWNAGWGEWLSGGPDRILQTLLGVTGMICMALYFAKGRLWLYVCGIGVVLYGLAAIYLGLWHFVIRCVLYLCPVGLAICKDSELSKGVAEALLRPGNTSP